MTFDLNTSKELLERIRKELGRKWLLAASIILICAIRFFYVASTPCLTKSGAIEENLLFLIGAENLNKFGWEFTSFLPDYVTSTEKQNHAVVYTHFPSLSTTITALLLKVGANIKTVRCFNMLVNCLGWILGFYFLKRIIKSDLTWIFLILTLFQTTNLIWADHFDYSWSPLLIFGCMFVLSQKWHNLKSAALLSSLILVASFLNYKVLSLQIGFLFIYLFLENEHDSKTKRNIVITVLTSFSVGIGMHLYQNIHYLGINVAFKDLYYTLANRVCGKPSVVELTNWYHDNNIVLWGSPDKLTIVTFLSNISSVLDLYYMGFKRLFPLYLWPLLILIFVNFKLLRITIIPKSAFLMLVSLTSGCFVWLLAFPAHAKGYFMPMTEALPIYFAAFYAWVLLIQAAENMFWKISIESNTIIRILCANFLLFVYLVFVGHMLYRAKEFANDVVGAITYENANDYIEEGKIIENYKDKVIWTNMTSIWVGYFTKTIVPGRCTIKGLKELDLNNCSNLLVNARAGLDFLKKPEIFIYSRSNLSGNVEDSSAAGLDEMEYILNTKHKLLKKSKSFSVYKIN